MKIVVVVLSLCFGYVEGMYNLPSLAIDSTTDHPELKNLSEFHKNRDKYGWYLPKNQIELDCIYQAYLNKLFDVNKSCFTLTKVGTWKDICDNVHYEILSRFLDGDKYFIDKYLLYFESFVMLTTNKGSKYSDYEFTKKLYNHGKFDLYFHLGTFVNSASGFLKEWKHKYPNISEELLVYTLQKLDKILEASGKYHNPGEEYKGLMNYYMCMNRLSQEYIDSLMPAIAAAFEEGVNLLPNQN